MGERIRHKADRPERCGRGAGLFATVVLHAGVFALLMQHKPVSPAIAPAHPLMVSFVSEPQTSKPAPLPVAKPKPVERKVVRRSPPPPKRETPAPLITAAPQAQSTFPSAPPAPEPQPTPNSASAPATQPTASAQVPAAPAPTVTQPSFNADYLQNPAPRYPPLARRMGQQGKVVLRVLVNAGGSASQVEVRTSSGSDVLDEAALEAVKRWRFVPAKRGDQPISAWVLVPITFTLQG
ncbi:MAG: TonB family protein [Rhodospirillaceae bacterium]